MYTSVNYNTLEFKTVVGVLLI